MPRRSSRQDSRVVTYRTLPGSSRQYQRANVGECTAWVQTNLTFELEMRGPDGTTQTKPYTVDTLHDWFKPSQPTRPSGAQADRRDGPQPHRASG
jgi:hypothetical protein